MRFVTYIDSQQNEKPGLQVGPMGQGFIINLQAALEWKTSKPGPIDLLSLIDDSEKLLPICKELSLLQEQGALPSQLRLPESKVKLTSPITRPRSMRDGYAFRQHVEAARRNRGVPMIAEFDDFPVFYFTNHLAVIGPGELKVQKLTQEQLDFELEVAVVTGKSGKNIKAKDADAYIFGYTIMNDWSARKLQMDEMKLNLGPAKGKDFATSLGPYLITKDELQSYLVSGPSGDRYNLKMKCFVNSIQVSDGNLKDMTWTFAQILERVSYGVQVHPGEVIGSGTVGTGCFLELNGSKITDNQWLKPGDRVVLEVEGLGKLENTVIDGGP